MRQKIIDDYIPFAYAVLSADNPQHKLPPNTKGLISSFGAAITLGSFLSAVAFYAKSEDKKKMLTWLVSTYEKKRRSMNNGAIQKLTDANNLFEKLCGLSTPENNETDEGRRKRERDLKTLQDELWAATVAIKAAANFFDCSARPGPVEENNNE